MGVIEILAYTILTVFLLSWLGYGLCVFFLPKKIQRYILWLSPWCAIVAIIFFGVILGLLGLTTKQWTPLVFIILSLLSYTVWYKQDFKFPRILKIDIFILFIFIIVTLLNLSPLFLQQKFITTLSMGSTDAQAYALVPDYLKNHSLLESLRTPVPQAVDVLIKFGYRWGPSVLTAFFLSVFNLAGYQFITLLQAILFSISIPLVYVLWNLFYKPTKYAVILALFMIGLNVNIIYFLYHNFFGQMIFLGLNLILIILLILYEPIKTFFNKQDVVIAIIFSVLFFSYSEASIFILFPMGVIILMKIFKRNEFINYILSYGKILFLTFLFGSFSVLHAFKFMIGFRVQDFYKPIGWQVFRQKIPFANPFEALGLYSIFSFEPLYLPLALLFSIFVAYLIYIGLTKSKRKDIAYGFMITYLFFFVIFAFIKPNFWAYSRAVSYSIPFIAIFFIGGIVEFVKNKTRLQKIVFILLLVALVFNIYKLNKQYIFTNLAVDKGLISLKKVPSGLFHSSIYTENVIQNTRPIWDELWIEYFMEPRINIINSSEAKKIDKRVSNGDLVLISKKLRYTPQTKVLLSKIIWENSSFKIGELCSSDSCLINSKEDLSKITINESNAEDTLLISGWGPREIDSRWINSSDASLKLITKENTSQLLFTTRSLAIPQQMSINIDNEKVASIDLTDNWKDYIVTLPKQLYQGVHLINLKFNHTYRPSDVLQTLDTRTLFANFKKIYLVK